MFKLASCLYVSQKVQNLVKLLSGSSDPSFVQSGECTISQACITENDGIAVHRDAFFYKLRFIGQLFNFCYQTLTKYFSFKSTEGGRLGFNSLVVSFVLGTSC